MTDELTATVHATMPMCATLGVTASKLEATSAVLHLPWRAELCTSSDRLHGGIQMALADAAGAACAFANLPAGAIGTSTIESKTNFLLGVTSGEVTATARPLHVGSTTIVVEVELLNDDRLVAKTTQTQIILRPR